MIGFFSKKYMDEMNNKMSFWGDNLKIYHFCSIHYITRTVDWVYHTGAGTVARGAASSPASCARAAGGRRPPWDRQQAGAGSVRTVPGSPQHVWWTPWSPGWTLSWRTLRTSRKWRPSYKGNVVFIIFHPSIFILSSGSVIFFILIIARWLR